MYIKGRQREDLPCGHLSDDELANRVYLTPDIIHLTAAKARIRWLSRQAEPAKAQQGAQTVSVK